MNRNDPYERFKITKVSTNKVVTNVYMDAFTIEKVRFQNANYETKQSIDVYLDFSQVSLLAADAISGRLFKQIDAAEKHQLTVQMAGTKNSKNYNGQPESRILSLGLMGDKIFINMSAGPGKLSSTGAIMPNGPQDRKISVGMTIDDFRRMMSYTHDCVNAYLTQMIPQLVFESEQNRQNYAN